MSVTSFAAPRAARKAYERATREAGRNKPNLARASAFLETAVALYPSFAGAWYFMEGVRLALNDADAPARFPEAALSADPGFPYAYLPLAAMELRAQHYAEAAKLADFALTLDYKLMDAHYYRALANTILRRHEQARQSIQTILDSHNDRQYPGVHAMLAVMLITEANFEAAATYSRFLDFDQVHRLLSPPETSSPEGMRPHRSSKAQTCRGAFEGSWRAKFCSNPTSGYDDDGRIQDAGGTSQPHAKKSRRWSAWPEYPACPAKSRKQVGC